MDQLPLLDPNFDHAEKLFAQRLKLENAYSMYRYAPTLPTKDMMKQLKYQSNKELGFEMGKKLGLILKEHFDLDGVDALVPIPLNVVKAYKRGYNQSKYIALGVEEILSVRVNSSLLFRKTFTKTQTKKSRYERILNMKNVFGVRNKGRTLKHVLIIDDVLTSGATMESAARKLTENLPCKVSIATLCFSDE